MRASRKMGFVYFFWVWKPSPLRETINKVPASASGSEEAGGHATPAEALGCCPAPRS